MDGRAYTATDSQLAARNLHPHAEARLAMALWSHEYAHEQRGGSMDFWDSLDERRKRLCVSILDEVFEAQRQNGRAPASKAAA